MKRYLIIKINVNTEKETNYGGGHTDEDVKAVTKGYKFNGMFYERKNSKYIYIVSEA